MYDYTYIVVFFFGHLFGEWDNTDPPVSPARLTRPPRLHDCLLGWRAGLSELSDGIANVLYVCFIKRIKLIKTYDGGQVNTDLMDYTKDLKWDA